jgi:hypothetical protein
MKKVITTAALAATLALASGNVLAEELWNPHLRGSDEGLAAGALPPQGVYLINDSYFAPWKGSAGNGDHTGEKLDAFVDVPIVLWNPGIKVLGADYAVAIAQPFDYTNLYSSSTPGTGHTGTFNTVVIPGQLSWALPHDFHVKTGLAVYVGDASSSTGKYAPSGGGAGAGNGFWTLEPELGISWLRDGWNLSADAHYDYNFKNETTDYNSGNLLSVEYTATKTIGKWTAGIGAYQQNQLERDQINGVSKEGTTSEVYGIGPLAGYDFGPVSLQATYNYGVRTQNNFGGDIVNVRLVAALY